MGDILEQLVLSGALFNGPSTGSPKRSPSPLDDAPPDSDRVLFAPGEGSDDESFGGTHITQSSRAKAKAAASEQQEHESIGLGPGRTGVKGVIRDRNEAREREAGRKTKDQEEVVQRLKKMDLSARTYFDEVEEEERQLRRAGTSKLLREGDAWQSIESSRRKQIMDFRGNLAGGASKPGPQQKFGHLREVGARGYIDAVENVPRGVWVVLHIYDASLQRCAVLDSQLSELARVHPGTKFVRVRAASIGFATSSQSGGWDPKTANGSAHSRTKVTSATAQRGKYVDPDESEDDDYSTAPSKSKQAFIGGQRNGSNDDDESDTSDVELEPDYDMLPTMLVYREGELMFNWVRVDWEVGEGGGLAELESLLSKHHILLPLVSRSRGRLSSDDDDLEGPIEFALGDDLSM